MHAAFLNRSYYPDTAATGQLLTELCEDLVRLHGFRVSVVTGPPLSPATGAVMNAGRGGLFARDRRNGVEILRARGTVFPKARFVGRATNYVTYFLSACWAALKLDKPDVIVALTDPPIIGLAGWMAAKRFRAPLVMAYQDLFPEVASLLPDFHSPTINAGLQAVNRFLCARATRIVALGETMRARLEDDKGAPPERTVIIPSWADTHAIAPGPKRNAFAQAHGLADRFVVMHSGNLGWSQGLEALVEAAALLRDTSDVQIVFQGEGASKPALEARASALGLSNVTFLPFAPKEQLGESFAAADVFVVSLQQGMAGYIVPSKLYGILASGRPYVAAVEDSCEVAAITRIRDCGLVVEPGQARPLADAIRTLRCDPALAARLGANARRASLEFDRAKQVATYAALLHGVAAPAPVPLPTSAA
jgi:glycosyltransferase involved in cell wall biosynthesis